MREEHVVRYRWFPRRPPRPSRRILEAVDSARVVVDSEVDSACRREEDSVVVDSARAVVGWEVDSEAADSVRVGTAKAVEGSAKAVEGSAKVVEDSAKVVEGSAKVVEDSAKAVEDSAKAVDEGSVVEDSAKVAEDRDTRRENVSYNRSWT